MRPSVRLQLALMSWALGMVSLAAPVVARAQSGAAIRCQSVDGKFDRCDVPWRDAQLVRQESKGACIRGQSWGMDRQGLWVDRGCRGLFAEAGGRGREERDDRRGHDDRGGGWQPGPDWDRSIRLQCDSNQKRYQMCTVDVGRQGRVRLLNQMSDTRCTEGYSWGWNRAGVWVDHGCRGQFVVDRRW